jgi:hypothetical protein
MKYLNNNTMVIKQWSQSNILYSRMPRLSGLIRVLK